MRPNQISNQCCGESVVPKKVEAVVPLAVQRLSRVIDNIDKASTTLWQRLNPVVRLAEEKPSSPISSGEGTGVPLADVLHTIANQGEDVLESIHRLTDQVEL